MHIMKNKLYPLADGFMYTDKDIFSQAFPRDITLAYRLFVGNCVGFASCGISYRHPLDRNCKKDARETAYKNLVHELDYFDATFPEQVNKSVDNNDMFWDYVNFNWKPHKKLVSFTAPVKHILNVNIERYITPRAFTPNFFKNLEVPFIKEHLTDEFFYDIITKYLYDVLSTNDALKASLWDQ